MRLPPKGQNLASLFPVTAKEWDYELNDFGPECYFPCSNAPANWICNKGHRWSAKINNRTTGGNQCPYCAGKKPIPGENDFATICPELLPEWAHTNQLNPSEVFPQSNKQVKWICSEGHEWEAKIYHRTNGEGCPYCAGLLPIVGKTDLETMYPDIAATWHPTLNNRRLPTDFTSNSHYEAWWICERGHEYPAPIYRRVRGSGCSVCDGKRIVPKINDLQTLAPNLAKEFHKTKNGTRTASNTGLHYNRDVWWQCSKCGHEWSASPNNRAAGRGCPACGHRCVDCNLNSLAAVRPDIAQQWDAVLNAPLTPYDVTAYDNRNYYWECEEGHSWPASPANRCKGTGCPFCNHKLPIIGENDLLTLHPALCEEWHPNNDKVPSEYLPQSHDPVRWICRRCRHEWEAPIYSRVNGSGCPGCLKRKAPKRHRI